MPDQEDNLNQSEIVFGDNNQERKSWSCLGQTCSRSLIGFLSKFLVILLIIFDCFWRIYLSKTCEKQLFGLEFCAVLQDTFYPHQENEQVSFFKKSSLYFIVGPSETWKSQLIYNWLKIGTFQPNLDIIYSFYQHSQPLYDIMQKEIKNLVFVQGVKFGFIDSLKNTLYKLLVNIWRFLWRDLQFKSLCWHCHRWETSGSEHNLH